ncbi:Uncharacterised protein [Peptoniphilus harei]|uniref:Magnesium transporter MgtE intracellular domain-containing protein n=1 Tax=Peptoniphilus harei TaxID=54005 RepID=A0A2X1XMH2_9FIRM|nr:hypothetical protein [Peptoniphilus harei]SPY43652.1 Uncharacterised protein [Peptoniphilus harei]
MNNLDREKLKNLQEKINRMDPVDIAENLEELSKEDVAIWIKLLKKDLLADAFLSCQEIRRLK